MSNDNLIEKAAYTAVSHEMPIRTDYTGDHVPYVPLSSHHPIPSFCLQEGIPHIRCDAAVLGDYVDNNTRGPNPSVMPCVIKSHDSYLTSSSNYNEQFLAQHHHHRRHYEGYGDSGRRRGKGRRYSSAIYNIVRTREVPHNVRVVWGKGIVLSPGIYGNVSSCATARLAEALMLPGSSVGGQSMIDGSYTCWGDTLLGDIVWAAIVDANVAMKAAGKETQESRNKYSTRVVKYFSSFLHADVGDSIISPSESDTSVNKSENECIEGIPSYYNIDRVIAYMVSPSPRGVLHKPLPVITSPTESLPTSAVSHGTSHSVYTPAIAQVTYLGTITLQLCDIDGNDIKGTFDTTNKSENNDEKLYKMYKVRRCDPPMGIILSTADDDQSGNKHHIAGGICGTRNANLENAGNNVLLPVRNAAFHIPLDSLGVCPGAVIVLEAKSGV